METSSEQRGLLHSLWDGELCTNPFTQTTYIHMIHRLRLFKWSDSFDSYVYLFLFLLYDSCFYIIFTWDKNHSISCPFKHDSFIFTFLHTNNLFLVSFFPPNFTHDSFTVFVLHVIHFFWCLIFFPKVCFLCDFYVFKQDTFAQFICFHMWLFAIIHLIPHMIPWHESFAFPQDSLTWFICFHTSFFSHLLFTCEFYSHDSFE